ncbi:MAG: dehydrogenase [Firmicutes bacterium]|nr:dehydrogenase [Bacillota bacterium]
MLFSPLLLRGLALKNRIVMPPMCMYSSERDGLANEWHFTHYVSRAVGQVGFIIMEATGIEDGGRITENDLGIWNDAQAEGLKRIIDAVHSKESKIAIQLGHAGRKSEVPYLEPVAPSALPFNAEYRTPQSLTVSDIQRIVDNFRLAAIRAVKAGFDAIELHAAHGYLINQFLSPLTNRREDEYGGTVQNRVRILAEVVEAVRNELPSTMPLVVRVSAYEYEPEGNSPEMVGEMLNMIKGKGIDLVHVSSGGVTPAAPRAYPGYQIGFAAAIKEKTGLPVIGGGLVTEPVQAEQIVKAGIDLVFLGRELLRNPYWPLMAAKTLGEDISWPKPYLRAKS